MGRLAVLAVLVVFTSSCTASIFSPSWNSLRVTWGLKVWQKQIFEKMPLTMGTAESKGFLKVPEDTGCSAGKFRGNRYIKDSSSALVLLFDKNGYFAGIQTAIPKKLVTNDTLRQWYDQSSLFQDDVIGGEKVYTLTAYLVDPATICTKGRTEDDYDDSKSGNQLSIQSGPNPETDIIKVPIHQEDLGSTPWTKGKCFPSMGVHYWYNTTADMNCNNFLPVFLLYNNDKLTGLGFATFGKYEFSNRYEHPPKESISAFMRTVPKCILDFYDQFGGFTTQHIFMNAYPWNLLC